LLGLAIAYPLALLALAALLRGIGERWALLTVALYVPRAVFALPLPFLTVALLAVRPRRWLLTQAVAALVLLFPLMGLELGGARARAGGAPRLRVMTFNIDARSARAPDLVAVLREADADVICLQEAHGDEAALYRRQLPGYVVRGDGQFIVASKHPIVDVYLPPGVSHGGESRDGAFVRYRIAAPGGLMDVYNVHPVSPHGPFDHLRGAGLLRELASGHLLVNRDAFLRVGANARLRFLQVRALAAHAGASPYPVLLAGDTNLPGGSWIFGRLLGAYQDGFVEVGRGFGYTFPARRSPPWLRLDRVLADERFRFVSFARLDVHASTHFPIVAELERVGI
jgi:endonuclease/exonuclease/phosphatase (EEP) superfamily protein YafD